MTEKDSIKLWTNRTSVVLVGRKIVKVRYMTKKEAEDCGFLRRAVVIQLDNGVSIFPSRDDEGNDAGALMTTDDTLQTIPVI